MLFKRHRVLVMPGAGFGENGEGHIWFSLTVSPEVYAEAHKRLSRRKIIKPRNRQ